jgi:hypothetical protein
MYVVQSLDFAALVRTFAMELLLLHLSVVERAPMRELLGIMRAGTCKGHVEVRFPGSATLDESLI